MPVDDLAVGADAVWAVGANVPGKPNLIRIDPASGETVATLTGIGGPIAVDSGSVWATTQEGSQWSLVKIDATTKQATTIPLDGVPYSVAIDGTAVWVLETNTGNGSGQNASKLVHVSADSGQVVGVIPVDVAYPMIAAGLGEAWVSQASPEGSTAIRIDATSNSQEGEPVPVATLFRPFAVAEGGVWFIAGPGQEVAGSGICRLNAETLKVDICIDPGTLADPLLHAVAIDSATGVLWVANYRGSVTRVDLA
jgi:hypothetical protein